MKCPAQLPTMLTFSLLLVLWSAAGETVAAQQGQVAKDAAPSIAPVAPSQLADSPGALRYRIVAENQQPAAAGSSTAAAPASPKVQPPVGAAAAESINTSGVAASAPSGAAIAPGKQRQVRSFLIKMGAVLGAGAAVGTVAALSSATSSKPPGAH